MEQLYGICDPIFRKTIELYEVETIVAIGKFCETRAQKVLRKYSLSSTIKVYTYLIINQTKITYALHKLLNFNHLQVLYMPHPSPRTVNNNDWDKKALNFLENHNLLQYYK